MPALKLTRSAAADSPGCAQVQLRFCTGSHRLPGAVSQCNVPRHQGVSQLCGTTVPALSFARMDQLVFVCAADNP